MAAKQSDESSEKHSRKNIEYNLEKDPLQTGQQGPRVGLHTKAAMLLRDWIPPRINTGLFIISLALLIVVAGALVLWLFVPLFRRYLTGG